MTTSELVSMMFGCEPIETFEQLLKEENPELKWGVLLDMCYLEASYVRVGGDYGAEENPYIDYEKLDYLEKLIIFLEQKGIKRER